MSVSWLSRHPINWPINYANTYSKSEALGEHWRPRDSKAPIELYRRAIQHIIKLIVRISAHSIYTTDRNRSCNHYICVSLSKVQYDPSEWAYARPRIIKSQEKGRTKAIRCSKNKYDMQTRVTGTYCYR